MSEQDTIPALHVEAKRNRGDGGVFLRGRIWWIRYSGPNEHGRCSEIRESSKSTERVDAEMLLGQRIAAKVPIAMKFDHGRYRRLFTKTRANAQQRDIYFGLTETEFTWLVRRSRGRCELSGIHFDFGYDLAAMKGSRRPFAPSIDRIDSQRGYTVDNCRIICVIANYALGGWGLETLLLFARGLVERSSPTPTRGQKTWTAARPFSQVTEES